MDIPGMVRDTDHYYLYDQMFDTVHAQGGLTGYAHVNSGNFHVHRDMSLNVPRAKADFVEILQFNNLGTDLYYDFLNLGCKLTASAGSDVPWGGTVGEVRAYAFLGRKPFSADAWFAAFRRGRTFTTSGPMLEFQVDQALPGDELRLKSDRRLRVHARAWGDPKRTASLRLEVVRHGAVIRSVESADPPSRGPDRFHRGCRGGLLAGGPGARRRRHQRAHHAGLCRARRSALLEVRRPGRAAGQTAGQPGGDRTNRRRSPPPRGRRTLGTDRARIQLAWQGDALLERVALARQLYEDLKRLAQAERPRRAALAR